jgi:hypothetical protein
MSLTIRHVTALFGPKYITHSIRWLSALSDSLYERPQILSQRHDAHRLPIWHTRDFDILVVLQIMSHRGSKANFLQLSILINPLNHRLDRLHSALLVHGTTDVPLPYRLEHTIRKSRCRRRFFIRALRNRDIQQRAPHPILALQLQQRRTLALQGMCEKLPQRILLLQIQHLNEIRNRNRQPRIPTRPPRLCEVVSHLQSLVAIIPLPAMEEKASGRVAQVLTMQKELALRFLDVLGPLEHHANLGKRQRAHHQRVVPEFVFVDVDIRLVLEPAVLCARQIVHDPFGPCIQPRHKGLVACFFVQVCEREEGGHGVDVFGGAEAELPREPCRHDAERLGVAGQRVVVPEAVEADAVRPFPAVPAFGVDDAPVGEFEQEFAGGVIDVDKVVCEEVDFGGYGVFG